jgi:hypothetical protein
MEPMNQESQQPTAYCRSCGKGLSADEVRTAEGTVYCSEHLPQAPTVRPASASPPADLSPGLAFLLGLIPGVGAIYNGQYAKGFVHVLIAGLLFSLAGSEAGPLEPLFGLMIPVWFFYMAFEAYHTAKKRIVGEAVDEFSSIFPVQGAGIGFPVLPLLLIALGIVFLLNNLEVIRIRQLMPFAGPAFLIGLGCYMLYARIRANAGPSVAKEVSHERR